VEYNTYQDTLGIDVVYGLKPPVGVSFDCILSAESRRLGSCTLVQAKSDGIAGAHLWFPGVSAGLQEVGLDLIPNPALVCKHVDITEIWGETIHLGKLTVHPARPAPRHPSTAAP
jgi:hypothetical protein